MSSLNPAQLGAFSAFVYKETQETANPFVYPARIPSGFVRLDVDPDTANGVYAAAFLNQQTGQVVIAFRGTDDFVGD